MWLQQLVTLPFTRIVDPGDPFSVWPLYTALWTAIVWYALRRPARWRQRAGAFVRAAFPRWWWTNPSFWADVKLYVATSLFYASGITGLLLAVPTVQRVVGGWLGPASPATSGWATPVAVVGGFLAQELGYWAAHYAMHRVPALWAFHKLHHSAATLSPLTEWRQHPVELLLFPLVASVVGGVWLAVADQALGTGATPPFSALTVVLVYTLLHLRHTHLWIPATGWLGRIVHSPAHHQIHHSTDPAHYDKNMGLFLSVWDWVFGTLEVPARHGRITFGVPGETPAPSLWEAWTGPFRATRS